MRQQYKLKQCEQNDAAIERLVQGTDPYSKYSVNNAFKLVILSNYMLSPKINMLHTAVGYVLELCAFIALPQLPSKVYNIDFSDQMHLLKKKERQCTYILGKKINILFYFPAPNSNTLTSFILDSFKIHTVHGAPTQNTYWK